MALEDDISAFENDIRFLKEKYSKDKNAAKISAQMAREFARQVAVKSPLGGRDPLISAFLERHIQPLRSVSRQFGGTQAMKEAFGASDIGGIMTGLGFEQAQEEIQGPPTARMQRIEKQFATGNVAEGLARGVGQLAYEAPGAIFETAKEIPQAMREIRPDYIRQGVGGVVGSIPDMAASVIGGAVAGRAAVKAAAKSAAKAGKPAISAAKASLIGTVAQFPVDYSLGVAGAMGRGKTLRQAQAPGLISAGSGLIAPAGAWGAAYTARKIAGAMSPPAAASKGAAPPPRNQVEILESITDSDFQKAYADARAARESASAELDFLRASNASREQISLAEERLANASARATEAALRSEPPMAAQRAAQQARQAQEMAAQQARQAQERTAPPVPRRSETMQRRPLELPAPGMTSGPRIISQRALEGQVVSPEVGSQQVMGLRNARIQAEATLEQLAQTPVPKAKPQADARLQQIRQAEGQVNLLREAELNTINAADAAARQRQFGESYIQAQNLAEETAARRAQQELRARQQQEANQYLELINQANTRLSAMERVPPAARTAEQQGAIDAMTNQVRQLENRLISLPQEFWAGTQFAPDLFGPAGRLGTPQAQARLGLQDVAQTMEITGPYGLGGFQASRVPVPPTPERGRVPFSPEMTQMPPQRFGEEMIPGVTVPPQGMMSRRYVSDIPGLAIPQRPPAILPAAFEEVIIPPTPRASKKKEPITEAAKGQRGGLIENLLKEEQGTATVEGAIQAILAPVKLTADLVRGMAGGVRSLSDFVASSKAAQAAGEMASRGAGATAEAFSKLGSVINAVTELPEAYGIRAKYQNAYDAAIDSLWSPAKTRFPTLNVALDNARRLWKSDFGVPSAVLAAEQAAETEARMAVNDVYEFANKLLDNVADDEARLTQLYRDIGDRNYSGADPLVIEAKSLIKKNSEKLLNYKALSENAYKAWGDSYLPRIYQKWLNENPASMGLLKALWGATWDDPILSGYYNRGLVENITADKLAEYQANGWEKLSPDVDAKGNPAKTYKVWRDWTDEEKAKWGEKTNVAVSLDRYARQINRELRNSSFLSRIADMSDANGRMAITRESLGFDKDPDTLPAKYIDPKTGESYTYIGSDKRRSGDIAKYGALSDSYVRDDIIFYIRTNNEWGTLKNTARSVKRALGVDPWKKLVTIGNPNYFINNAFHAFPQIELAGGTVADIPTVAKLLTSNDPAAAALVKQATDLGVIRDGAAARDFSIRLAKMFPDNALPPGSTGMAKAFEYAKTGLRGYEDYAYKVATTTEDIGRLTVMYGLMRRQKLSAEEAAKIARESFYQRKDVKSVLVDIAEPIIPFAAVAHWEVRKLPYYSFRNPVKAAYIAGLIPFTTAAISRWMTNTSEEEIEALQDLLPQNMRNPKFFGFEVPLKGVFFRNSLYLGKDVEGRPKFVDTSSWNKLNSLTAEVPYTAWPLWLRSLSPGGFLPAAAQTYFNIDPQSGRPIIERGAEGEPLLISGYGPLRDYLARQVTPGIITKPFEVMRAVQGQPTLSGQYIDVPTALSRAAGFKTRNIDVQRAIASEESKYERQIDRYELEIDRLAERYLLAEQKGDEATMNQIIKDIDSYQNKIMQTAEKMQNRMQKLAPALSQ